MTTVVGVAWFTPGDWDRLRAVAPDADQLQATFEEWQGLIETRVAEFRAAGVRWRRVPVSASALLAWCDVRGCRPDAHARAQYVASELQRVQESSSS